MNPESIYDRIINELKKLREISDSSIKDEEVQATQQKILTFIDKQETKIRRQIVELRNLSEWDEFTVAFYGETNAGKSTLIDALRSILYDPEKVRQHQEFDNVDAKYQNVVENIKNSSDKLENIKQNQAIEIENISLQSKKISTEIIRLKQENESLMQVKIFDNWQIMIKSLISLRYFIKAVFHRPDEMLELVQIDDVQQKIADKIDQSTISLNMTQYKQNTIVDKYLPETTKVTAELASLKKKRCQEITAMTKLEDGQSIGDGRSDYTRTAVEYHLSVKGIPFKIIDLPGIEGAESEVIKEINTALKSAHAVFYISRKSTPPQNGEDENGGTIGKIRQQLSSMSEVYFVYNKKTTNPRDMKEIIETAEENIALEEVDKILSDVLGEHYIGHQTVIGLGGHYAVSRFTPESRRNKKQTKYLNKFDTREKLLNLSGMQKFADYITGDLVTDVKRKIKIANFSKVSATLLNLKNTLDNNLQGAIIQKNKLENLEENTNNQISSLNISLKDNIQKNIRDAVRMFNYEIRKALYEKIEINISDEELKAYYKTTLTANAEDTQKRIQESAHEELKKYQMDAQKVMKQYYEFADNIFDSSNSTSDTFDGDDLNINRNFIKGEDVTEILVGVASAITSVVVASGAVAASSVVVAIVAGILSAAAFALNIGKKVVKAINPKYKKAEQSKYVDKQLDKDCDKLEKQLTEIIMPTVNQAIEKASIGLKEQRNANVQLGVIVEKLQFVIAQISDVQKVVYIEMR